MDGFKHINDSLGHAASDQVLVAVARALEALNLPSDSIGRFGGDEFLILIRPGTHGSITEGAAATVAPRFKEPLLVDGRSVPIGASVGAVIVTNDYDDIDPIVEDANTALSVAKCAGGGRSVLFEPIMRRDAQRRARMRTELDVALNESQLVLHYQPVFDLDSMRPVGFEALLRWHHPDHGLLCAADFLPIAERCGLLSGLSAQVIGQAFRQVSAWQRAGLWRHGEYLSINISPQQLADERLLEQLDEAFKRYLVDPTRFASISRTGRCRSSDLCADLPPAQPLPIDDFYTVILTLTSSARHDQLDAPCQRVAHLTLRTSPPSLPCSLVSAEGIETVEQLSFLQSMGYR